MQPAPTPWRARPQISQGMFLALPAMAEAMKKTVVEVISIGLRPIMSLSRALIGVKTTTPIK